MENFNQEVDSLRKTWREIEEQRRGNPDLLGNWGRYWCRQMFIATVL